MVVVPSAGASFSLFVDDTLGTSTLVAFAGVKPLNLDALRSYASDGDHFAQMKVTGLSALRAGLNVAANAQPGNLYAQTAAEYTVLKSNF